MTWPPTQSIDVGFRFDKEGFLKHFEVKRELERHGFKPDEPRIVNPTSRESSQHVEEGE